MNYEKMSREELITSLVAMVAARSAEAAAVDDATRLFHDLQVHQIELEMQNRELHEARSELEESRNRYADLYDFAPVAYFTLDSGGIVHDLNLSAANLLRHERDRIVGHPLTKFITFKQPTAFWQHLGKCAASSHTTSSELEVQVGDSSYVIQAISVATHGLQAAVRPQMFRTAFSDITGRKRTEAELERAYASEQSLRAQIEAVDRAHLEVSSALASAQEHRVAKVVEVILSHAMVLTKAHRAELQFVDGVEFGPEIPRRYSSGKLLPFPCAHFFTPLSFGGRELAVLTIYRVQAPERSASVSDCTLDMYAERIASVLEVARLQALECRERERLAILDKITRELEHAQTASEMEQALAVVLSHVVPAIARACTIHVRRSGQLKLVGYHHPDSAGRDKLAQALARPGQDLEDAFRKLAELQGPHALVALAAGNDPQVPLSESQRKALVEVFDGHLLVVTPLLSRGRSLGLMCFEMIKPDAIDAPHAPFQEKCEDALARAREVAARCAAALDISLLVGDLQEAVLWRESMMATISHDLRSPLNTIALGTNAMLEERQGEKDAKHANLIQRSVDHMDAMINDLVTMSAMEGGAFHVDVQELPAQELVQDACGLTEPMVRARSISLECSASSRLPTVAADRGRIQRVFANLIANAVKYTPAGGTIEVAALGLEDRVLFSVSDSGRGIPNEERERIFERFWRANIREHGLGLGLYIARSIVEAHGGTIWVETASLGGAKFCFYLPRAKSVEKKGPGHGGRHCRDPHSQQSER